MVRACSKDPTLHLFCAQLNFSFQNTVAFGVAASDSEKVQEFLVGVIVANAMPTLKNVVRDQICNDLDDGVAIYLGAVKEVRFHITVFYNHE